MIDNNKIRDILIRSAEAALDGTMTDTDRVALYNLAMTIAAEELYRVEQRVPGVVSPESLTMLHQVALLCDPNVTTDQLLGPHITTEPTTQEEDAEEETSSE